MWRLVVLGIEVGGRWSQESADFFRLLAQHKARAVPAPSQQTTTTSRISRWSAILAHAGMHAFAASVLSLPADELANGEGVLPPLGHLLAQLEAAPTNPRRLPGRWGRTTFGLRRGIAPVDFCFGFCCVAHFAADQLRPKRSKSCERQ